MKKPEQQAAKGSWGQFFRFVRQIRLDWPLIILALVVSIIYYEVIAYIPGSTAALMSGDFSSAAIMSVVVFYGCQLLLSVVINLVSLFATSRSVRSARNTIWSRMMGVQTSFYQDNTPEELLSAITNDTQAAVNNIVTLATATIPSVYYMFRSFSMVSGYSWKLLLTLLIMVPVYILYGIFVGKWQFKTSHRIQSRIGGLTGYLAERLRNLSLIKSYANEAEEDANGQHTVKELYKAKSHAVYINSAAAAYIMGTEVISIVSAVLIAAVLMRNGELTIEGWLAFYMFLPRITGVMRQLSMSWVTIKGVQGSAIRLGRIIDAPQEVLEQGKPVAHGDVAFQNVSFAYGEEATLSNVSFTAPVGKVTALVGLSGSGKSTMLALLERLYTPAAGSITLGGQDISQMDLTDYRRRFAYVQQNAEVFSGSFRDILTYGVEKSVTDEDLLRVTKLAGIYDFIAAQPNGFETKVAPWGASLSGGQRQRLVIAREVLKDADVLLFDEPTSALDPKTARAIQDTILHTFRGKTVLMVSHDLSLVGAADQIVVVDQGSIQAAGTHKQLMDGCPLYHDLVEEQSYQEVFAQ